MFASRISALILVASAVFVWLIATSFMPPTPQAPTPEEARLAILDGIRKGRIGDGFSTESPGAIAEKMSTYPFEKDGDWWHVGVFRLNPRDRKFTFLFGPSDPHVRACTFFFEGRFVYVRGQWIAAKPVEVMSALGGGR